MREINIQFKVDTNELDEAIVKAKILNEELEKAKSLINDIANSKNEKNEMPLTDRPFLVAAELKSFEYNVLSDEDVKRIAKETKKEIEKLIAWNK